MQMQTAFEDLVNELLLIKKKNIKLQCKCRQHLKICQIKLQCKYEIAMQMQKAFEDLQIL